MSLNSKSRVAINISGEIFETYEETLARFPTTLLGDKQKCQKHYCYSTQQYFFQRSRLCFESILHFYQSNGTLKCPQGIDIDLFDDECRFFCIPKTFIDSMKRKEGIFPELQQQDKKEPKNISFRNRGWNILENPDTSDGAWYFGMASLLIVWLSILSASVETLPSLKSLGKGWGILELSLNVWFLVELVMRMLFCEHLLSFLKESMNLIDIMAILPYFVILLIGDNDVGASHQVNVTDIFKTLKFLRVCRLFRFSRHSRRLMVAGKILQGCMGNFRLLMLCLAIVITLGGTFIYVVEDTPQDGYHDIGYVDFYSIPASLWWSVQTITSVGYGDLIPNTFIGRLFAASFMLLGVVTISLPILTIVTQFAVLYPKNVNVESNSSDMNVGGTTDGSLRLPKTSSARIRTKQRGSYSRGTARGSVRGYRPSR